jgi:processive 1,2-diacylglycerol beta-glucosyltransferase
VILILTAGFGDGHNTAARNVSQALTRLQPDLTNQVVDLFDIAHPLVAPALKQGYQMLITRAPSIWAGIYKQAASLDFNTGPDILAALRRALGELLQKTRPVAIISTYPIYPRLIRELAEKGFPAAPVYTVITDSISIHPIWMISPSDGYFVADADSRKSAIAIGAPADLIHISGFPVSLDFMNEVDPADTVTPHGQILYLPSTSTRHFAQTLEALRPLVARGVKLTLPVGKHASRLHLILTRFIDSLPGANIEVIGWTNRIPHLLQTHDFVICKAGGAILHEALAATCPAIIDYVVPGQEEGNAELLAQHGCGVTTKTPQETGEQAARFLADDRKVAKNMKRNMQKLSEPAAALKIAQRVLATL